MAEVDAGLADWLKSESLTTVRTAAGVAWGDRAVETEITTPIANKADAVVEGDRQIAFLRGPLVEDRAVVPGKRKDLQSRAITLTGDRLGYEGAGAVCFVLGVQENDNGTSTLRVLKRLG